MTDPAEERLQKYADLTVKVGLNLRAGQRLLIIGPLANGGASLEAAPLIRPIAVSAYALKDENPELISAVQLATARGVREFREQISRNQANWTVVSAAGAGWAAKVFPGVAPEEQVSRLWDAIGRLCRLDRPDPIAAWETHLADLASRRDQLNAKRYTALKYRGPGTDLIIGLPTAHTWVSGRSVSRSGIEFAPNLPTEEVFTMAHKDRVEGLVRSTKPLSYGGTLIEGFSLRFEQGRVVSHSGSGVKKSCGSS